MIINRVEHSGFLQVGWYHQKKVAQGKARLLYSNLLNTSDPKAMAREFEAIAASNPKVRNALNHAMISLKPGENLSDAQMRTIAMRYIHRLGYPFCQCAVWRHDDTDHPHIHIVLNRVRVDSGSVPIEFTHVKQEALARDLELEFGLEPTFGSFDSLKKRRRKPTKAELEGTLKPETVIAQCIHEVLDSLPEQATFMDFAGELCLYGVVADLYDRDEHHKFPRLMYGLGEETFSAVQIDRASTIEGLKSWGMDFSGLIAPGEPTRRFYRVDHSPRPSRRHRSPQV